MLACPASVTLAKRLLYMQHLLLAGFQAMRSPRTARCLAPPPYVMYCESCLTPVQVQIQADSPTPCCLTANSQDGTTTVNRTPKHCTCNLTQPPGSQCVYVQSVRLAAARSRTASMPQSLRFRGQSAKTTRRGASNCGTLVGLSAMRSRQTLTCGAAERKPLAHEVGQRARQRGDIPQDHVVGKREVIQVRAIDRGAARKRDLHGEGG